jgi:hypothetical protein
VKFKYKNGKLYFKIILNEKEVAVSRKYCLTDAKE